MTNEQAIAHGIEQLEIFGGEHREFIKLAIQALEQEPKIDDNIHREREQAYMQGYEDASKKYRQEPKTVLYSGDGYADGYMVYDMAECPNCGYEYEDGDKDWGLSFCPNCGQKLNWESEE